MNLKAAWQARSSAELEQAVIRIVFVSILVLMVLELVAHRGTLYTDETAPWPERQRLLLVGMIGCLVLATGIFAAVWTWPAPSTWRRILGVVTDVGIATLCLLFPGSFGATFLGLYLFFIIGHGFRFGRVYLHISQFLSLLGFALVVSGVEWWQYQWHENNALLFSWLVALIILPLYIGVLLGRLQRRSNVT